MTARRGDLVVATWNIRAAIGSGPFPSYWWRHIDRPRLERIAGFIAGLDADVVALQEVGLMTVDGDPIEMPGDLGRLTGMAARFAALRTFPIVNPDSGAPTGAGLWGNAILSRLPIRASATIALPQGEDDEPVEPAGSGRELAGIRYADAPEGVREPRCALRCEIDVDGAAINILSTHLTYAGSSQRGRQAQRLADVVAGLARPVVLAGDLNAPIEAPELRVLGNGLVDAFAATGTRPGDPRRESCGVDRIDHLLVRDLVPTQCRVVREAGDLSDHWPVVATFAADRA